MVILEEIRSQNRATLETVEASHQETRRELHEFRDEVRGDNRVVQAALREHSGEIRQLNTEVGTLKEHLTRIDAVINPDYRKHLHRLEEKLRPGSP
jgi:hypothetical protein